MPGRWVLGGERRLVGWYSKVVWSIVWSVVWVLRGYCVGIVKSVVSCSINIRRDRGIGSKCCYVMLCIACFV